MRLGRAMNVQLTEAEAARLKRTPAANPNAEDLALQCRAALNKHGWLGKEAEPGMRLCEQALALDPNNVRALSLLAARSWLLVAYGLSADRKRGDELASQALALDPNYAYAHFVKGGVLESEGRFDEAIMEFEHTLALDSTAVYAYAEVGWNYLYLGQFEKSLAIADKAIRISPYDPTSDNTYDLKAKASFGLKQYDQTIDFARRAIGIAPAHSVEARWFYFDLIPALALTGREAEAHEALQSYLNSVPDGPKTIAAWKAAVAQWGGSSNAPRYLEMLDRIYDGLRKAGMPEGEQKTN
jgi:tetratricopeptide (TPR) repeat protein